MKLHIFPGVDIGAGVGTGVVVGAGVGVGTGVCVNSGRGVVTGVGVRDGVIGAGVYWAVSIGVGSAAAGTGVDIGVDSACSLFNLSTADSLVVCTGTIVVTGVDWLFFNPSPGNF